MIYKFTRRDSVKSCRVIFTGVFLFAVALLMVMAERAAAANIVVNSLADTQANNGLCTLREAIINANNDNQAGSTDCAAGSGADTITFSVSGTITFALSVLSIFSDITVDGGSAITISGNNSAQVFSVNTGASLTLENLTVKDGNAGNGGGINNKDDAILTITNSTLSGNFANFQGGGIHNSGTLTITNSTVSGNRANGQGGGIRNQLPGTATITNSTLSNNSAAEGGGGVDNSSGTVTITNSTLSGNSAPTNGGGGILNFDILTITNSTLSGNSAPTDPGGGIANGGIATITNSIVANSPSGGNCSNGGTITDGGNNIDDGTTCGFSVANNSQPSTNPLLDPAGLTPNGGPTKTIALCTGVNAPNVGCTGPSPAIDAGTNTVCAAAPVNNIDQRGFVRPVDGDGSGTATCDIGAFEAKAGPLNINSLVTFVPIRSTFQTTSNNSGCPAGFVGKFSFNARLTDKTSPALSELMAKVTTLTNGNLLQNADGGPGGAGAILTVSQGGQYSDGVLSPNEFVDVPFIICLKQMAGFSFFVDVLGLTH